MTPFLKWAGGKRWQVPLLQRIWAEQRGPERRLVEPFCGGLSVALALEPRHALLSDINPHLINFYQMLQTRLDFCMEDLPDDYYGNREWFNRLVKEGQRSTFEAAMLFYFLNRRGFNGLCRFNRKGEFNVPEGRGAALPQSVAYDDPRREKMRHWQFRCDDFAKLPLFASDFVYADPPYDDGFTNYSGTTFTWHDQERLADWLADRMGIVVITNLATPRILALYRDRGFHTTVMGAPRRIAANGNRATVLEVMATNFPIALAPEVS